MSTAEKIFQKAQTLPEPVQDVLLQMAEMLATKSIESKIKAKPQFGSAKGLIEVGPEFDEPLDGFDETPSKIPDAVIRHINIAESRADKVLPVRTIGNYFKP